jgi:hypothetical protein
MCCAAKTQEPTPSTGVWGIQLVKAKGVEESGTTVERE